MKRLRFLGSALASGALASSALAVAPAARAGGAEPIVVNVIALPSAAAGSLYDAQEMGFFKAAGLDVRITPMTSSPAIVAAVVSGAADVGFAAIGSAAAARERGLPVRFIAPGGMYVSANPTSLLVGAKDTPIRTAADLEGKTVAVTGLADLTYFGARAWIDANGGDSSRVKFVELPFPQMAPALAQHRVDAAVTTEPFLTIGKDEERPIAAINDAIAARFMITGWLAREAWIAAHPDAAARFAGAIRQAAAWANAHGSASVDVLVRYTQIPAGVAASMRRLQYALTLDPKLLQPPIDNAARYGDGRALPAAELIWTPPR